MSKNRINSERNNNEKKTTRSCIHTKPTCTVHTQPFRSLKYGVLDSFFSIQRAQTVFLFWIWCVAGVCLFIATVRFSFVFVHEMSNFVIYQYAGSRSYIRWSYYINRLAEVRHKTTFERFGKFQTAVCCGVIRFCYIFFKFFFSSFTYFFYVFLMRFMLYFLIL